MKIITIDVNEINSWERLAMRINTETRVNDGEIYPQVEFIIGRSDNNLTLSELSAKVEQRMAELKVFGQASKKWLRFSNGLEVFAIVKWPSPWIQIEFVCTPDNFGIQIETNKDPYIQVL